MSVNGTHDFVCSADFNNDGKLDLAGSSYGSRALSLLLGNGDGTFAAVRNISLSLAPDFVGTADFNLDNRPDLYAVSFAGGVVMRLLNDGAGNFSSAIPYSAGAGPRAAVVADFNRDGKPDLALAKSFDKNLTILSGAAGGAFNSAVNVALSYTPSDLAAGDFNADAKPDLAAVDFFGNSIHILTGNGAGGFSDGASITVSTGPTAIAAADLNDDGKLDLITANFLAGNLSVSLGNGNGTFQSVSNIAAGKGATFVTSTDFDGDANLDLISADATDDTISVLLGHGDGGFDSPVTRLTDINPRALAVADFNGDLAPDVAAANQGAANLSLFLSDQTPPKAAVIFAPPITTSGESTYDFNIRYDDNIAMDASSMSNGDLLVTGPNGFSQLVSLVSVTGGTASRRVGTYRVTAPSGFWKPNANGAYSIQMQAGQVTDSAGNFVRAKTLGSFTVAAFDAGNSLPSAQSVGKIVPGRVRTQTDYIGIDDRNDHFSFTLSHTTRVYGKLYNLSDNADLQLLDSAGRRIGYSKRGGTAVEFFDRDLPAGTYYARVLFTNGIAGTGYRMRFEGGEPLPPPSDDNTPATARYVGSLAPGTAKSADDFVGINDRDDYFRFRLEKAGAISLKLTGMTDDADLQLVDSAGKTLATARHAGISNESFTRKSSPAGIYYARVLFRNGVRGTGFRLRLAAS